MYQSNIIFVKNLVRFRTYIRTVRDTYMEVLTEVLLPYTYCTSVQYALICTKGRDC